MKQNSLRRLFSYSWRYKWSFLISIFGFILFASADIAAVEWIRQIIGFINDNSEDKQQLLALSLIGIALARGLGFFIGNYFMAREGFGEGSYTIEMSRNSIWCSFNISEAREGFGTYFRKSVTWVQCICEIFKIPVVRARFGEGLYIVKM